MTALQAWKDDSKNLVKGSATSGENNHGAIETYDEYNEDEGVEDMESMDYILPGPVLRKLSGQEGSSAEDSGSTGASGAEEIIPRKEPISPARPKSLRGKAQGTNYHRRFHSLMKSRRTASVDGIDIRGHDIYKRLDMGKRLGDKVFEETESNKEIKRLLGDIHLKLEV